MIDTAELNTWISSTEEGRAWAEALKAPLLTKRDELLESLRQANGKAAEALRAKADAEALLASERTAIEKLVVDDALAAALEKAHVFKTAIPGIVAELKESYGLQSRANGEERKALGKIKDADGTEREASIDQIVERFTASELGKSVTSSGLNVGGGAIAPSSAPRLTREAVAAMDPRTIAARLDDPAFRAEVSTL